MKCPRCGEPEHPDQCTIPARGEVSVKPRFFIDHGMVHDRVTGRHVTTNPDEDTWAGMTITETCKLLNELNR